MIILPRRIHVNLQVNLLSVLAGVPLQGAAAARKPQEVEQGQEILHQTVTLAPTDRERLSDASPVHGLHETDARESRAGLHRETVLDRCGGQHVVLMSCDLYVTLTLTLTLPDLTL